MGLHGVNHEVEEGSDLDQGLVEHVLQDDDDTLDGGELDKARHRGFYRLLCINISKGSGWARSATSVATSIGSAMRTSRLRSRSSARL